MRLGRRLRGVAGAARGRGSACATTEADDSDDERAALTLAQARRAAIAARRADLIGRGLGLGL